MLTYKQRAQLCTHPLAKKLCEIIEQKQSNLALTVDIVQKQLLLELVDLIGPEICVLKTHIDVVADVDATFLHQLKALAKKHEFIIFEDRKFADIGNTVKLQYEGGVYRIADWAEITNAHIIMGPGTITGLKQVGMTKGNGLLLLAHASSKENLIDERYTQAVVEMAKHNHDFVIGFIAQHKLLDDPTFIHFTPGIHLATEGDHLGQGYTTPQQAIARGCDVLIVGRGICHADDPLKAAKEYKQVSWQAYQNALTIS